MEDGSDLAARGPETVLSLRPCHLCWILGRGRSPKRAFPAEEKTLTNVPFLTATELQSADLAEAWPAHKVSTWSRNDWLRSDGMMNTASIRDPRGYVSWLSDFSDRRWRSSNTRISSLLKAFATSMKADMDKGLQYSRMTARQST